MPSRPKLGVSDCLFMTLWVMKCLEKPPRKFVFCAHVTAENSIKGVRQMHPLVFKLPVALVLANGHEYWKFWLQLWHTWWNLPPEMLASRMGSGSSPSWSVTTVQLLANTPTKRNRICPKSLSHCQLHGSLDSASCSPGCWNPWGMTQWLEDFVIVSPSFLWNSFK